MVTGRSLLLALLIAFGTPLAQEPASLEAYGALPEVSSVTISPDGQHIAFRRLKDQTDVVVVVDLEQRELRGGIDVSSLKPRQLTFIDNDTLLLVASDTMRPYGYLDAWEHSGAFVYKIGDNEVFQLLDRANDLFPAQTGLGRIVGQTPAGDRVLMPAYVRSANRDPRYSLYSASTESKRQQIVARGLTTTVDWFVNEEGQPFIREDFDNQQDLQQIWLLEDGDERLLWQEQSEVPSITLEGLTADRRSLLVSANSAATNSTSLFSMSTETGEFGARIFGREDAGIQRVIRDVDRVIYGVEYEGFYPTYEFFDERLEERMNEIQRMLPHATARLVSWSDDFRNLIIHASGNETSGAYLLFAEGADQPEVVAREREQIQRGQIASVIVEEYEARDGLTIPALITARPQVIEAGSAPLIVLPHGGPAAFDEAGFHWLAQFFASRGYVVLQPQFRGSRGFGAIHRAAGDGEWGAKMQTDLDDGVAWLSGQGLIDPERVCIVGASYGGYAALAAAAFSSEIYRCHVSINGVSDLRLMLVDNRRRYSRDHWLVSYWERLYGAEFSDRDELDALSPARHADAFQSPVLLVHGRDDTVVPLDQSRRMRNALRRAGKDVEFAAIKGEDHWLSSQETRIEVLRLVAEFIEQHL